MVEAIGITEQLPTHCGYPWPPGGFHAGCGCGKAFSKHAEIYRCTDCTVNMHRRCLVEHFADGCTRTIDGHGQVRSPTHGQHHFALQTAWAVEEVRKRDGEIARLQHWITAIGMLADGEVDNRVQMARNALEGKIFCDDGN